MTTSSVFVYLKRVYYGIPDWLLALTILFPVLGFLLGWFAGEAIDPSNTRTVLSTLAIAQASVLAIVFSVTVIGIQLVATRYSPRLISLFTDAPILIFTFAVFILSIAVDLGLLYSVPTTESRIHIAGVYTAVTMGMVAAISLFVFIRVAIHQSTPEGIIETFVNDLTADKYLWEVKQSVEDDLQNVHPLEPLYTMIMEALSNRRRTTTEIALRNYGNHAMAMLEEFKERDSFDTEDKSVARDLFKSVLKEQLPRIVLHAEEQDETEIVSEATDVMYKLGEAGLDLPKPTVSRQAVWGLTDVIIHSPIDSGEYISSNAAWRNLGELLEDASEYPKPEVVWDASSTIMSRGPQMLWRAHDGMRFRHSMTRLYRNIDNAHGSLLDQFGANIANVDIEWWFDSVPDDAPNKHQVKCVYRLREALFRTTNAFIEYSLAEGLYPILEGNFKTTWERICIDASNSPAQDYAIVLCQALIELAYIDEQEEGGLNWPFNIARIKHEGDPEIVDLAFERILSYDQEAELSGPLVIRATEGHPEDYYKNILSMWEYGPLNTQPRFKEIVVDIREQVDERWEYLR